MMKALRLRLLAVLCLATIVALAPSALGWGGWSSSSASGVTPAGAVLPSTLTFSGTGPYLIQGNGAINLHSLASANVTVSNGGYTAGIGPTGSFFNNGPQFSVGSNPATTGALAIPNNTFIAARNQGNSGDIDLVHVDTANEIVWGDFVNVANIFQTSGTFNWQISSANYAALATTGFSLGVPLGGYSSQNAPLSEAQVTVAITTGNQTLTNAQYVAPYIRLQGSLTGNVAVIFPTTLGACWTVNLSGVTLNAHAVVFQANGANWGTTPAIANEYRICYGDQAGGGGKLYGTTYTP